MPERRFWVPEIGPDRDVELVGAEAHHLLHVLRLQPGDEITLFDGLGHAFRARLTARGRDTARARALSPLPNRESPLEVRVALAVPRFEAMGFAVQKLTELGVTRITPLRTARGRAPSAGKHVERWRRIAAEACKQSGRARIPDIEPPVTLGRLLEGELPELRLLASLEGDPVPDVPPPRACLIVVGPEGGWGPEEEAAAIAAGFRRVGLGPRTLRTETAALVLTAIAQSIWGDGRSPREDHREER